MTYVPPYRLWKARFGGYSTVEHYIRLTLRRKARTDAIRFPLPDGARKAILGGKTRWSNRISFSNYYKVYTIRKCQKDVKPKFLLHLLETFDE